MGTKNDTIPSTSSTIPITNIIFIEFLQWLQPAISNGLNAPEKQQDHDDDEHQAKASGRVIAPVAAMRPARQSAEQSENHDYEQYCSKHELLLLFPEFGWLSAAPEQVHNHNDHGDDEQHVYKATGDVEAEAEKPQDQENCDDGTQHGVSRSSHPMS